MNTINIPPLGPGEEYSLTVSGPAVIRITGRPDDRDLVLPGEVTFRSSREIPLLRPPEPPARWGVALLIGLGLFFAIAFGVALWLGSQVAGLFIATSAASFALAARQPV